MAENWCRGDVEKFRARIKKLFPNLKITLNIVQRGSGVVHIGRYVRIHRDYSLRDYSLSPVSINWSAVGTADMTKASQIRKELEAAESIATEWEAFKFKRPPRLDFEKLKLSFGQEIVVEMEDLKDRILETIQINGSDIVGYVPRHEGDDTAIEHRAAMIFVHSFEMASLLSEVIDDGHLRDCNPQSPELENMDKYPNGCPADHPDRCGYCDMRHRIIDILRKAEVMP